MKKLRIICLTALIALLTASCLPAMAAAPATWYMRCVPGCWQEGTFTFVEYCQWWQFSLREI